MSKMFQISRSNVDLLRMYDDGHKKGFLTRLCYYYFIAARKEIKVTYPPIEEFHRIVLKSETVLSAIQTTADRINKESGDGRDEGAVKRTLESKAAAFASEMIGTVTSRVIRFCGWIYLTMLKQVCTSVQFSAPQIQSVQEAAHGDIPVVYMPLHFSHVDYILVSLLLFHNSIRVPYIASGDNLQLPVFGYFIKRAGGFFIRRKLNDGNQRDLVYRAVLQSYVSELLKGGQSLEIFLEGTRSRSGLPNYPKTGLLSLLVDAVVDGQIPDVHLIPVSISYEKLFEGNFDDELMGRPKPRERLFSVLVSIFRMLRRSYGSIKINFGDPISLRLALRDICQYSSCKNLTFDSLPSISQNDGGRTVIRKNSSDSFQSPQQDSEWRRNISLLAEHIVYGGLKCHSFMATNLVSFLLVNKWRDGVYLPDLVASFTQLKKEIISRGRDIGFCGKDRDAVLHAINILGGKAIDLEYIANHGQLHGVDFNGSGDASISAKKLESAEDRVDSGIYLDFDQQKDSEAFKRDTIKNKRSKGNPTLRVRPILSIPEVFELTYYSNAFTPMFSLESVVCLSITAITGFRYTVVQEKWNQIGDEGIFEDSLPEKMKLSFLRSELVDKALELTDFLQIDLFLCDVTSNLEECIKDTIHNLVSAGILSSKTIGNSKATHMTYGLDEEENFSEDQWLNVQTSSIPKLLCYQSVLAPMVEALAVVTEQLKLLSNPMPESRFIALLLEHASERVEDDTATRAEYCSKETLCRCIRAFKCNKVVEAKDEMLKLSHEFNSSTNLDHLLNKICQYLM